MVEASMSSAFLITSHADIPQLRRLVERLLTGAPEAHVYINHDRAGDPGVESLAAPRCHVTLAAGGRGDFSQVERILSLLRAVEADGGAEYVTLLSGADYPSRPVSEFVSRLPEAGDGYLHHFPALDPTGSDWSMHEARQRYAYRWVSLWSIGTTSRDRWHWLHGVNYTQPFFRVNLAYGAVRVGFRRRRMPAGLTIYGGSSWFTISRRAVHHVLATVEKRPDVMDWGRSSLAIDEAFFHSILMSAESFDFVNSNARYIDFGSVDFGHPKVLTEQDLDRIAASEAFFVRKIDRERSAGLLEELDLRKG